VHLIAITLLAQHETDAQIVGDQVISTLLQELFVIPDQRSVGSIALINR